MVRLEPLREALPLPPLPQNIVRNAPVLATKDPQHHGDLAARDLLVEAVQRRDAVRALARDARRGEVVHRHRRVVRRVLEQVRQEALARLVGRVLERAARVPVPERRVVLDAVVPREVREREAGVLGEEHVPADGDGRGEREGEVVPLPKGTDVVSC